MNRYNGSSGRVTKYRPMQGSHSEQRKFENAVEKVIRTNNEPCCRSRMNNEFGDIWILAVFFLLYLESGDTDFLIILAVVALSMFNLSDIKKLFGGI